MPSRTRRVVIFAVGLAILLMSAMPVLAWDDTNNQWWSPYNGYTTWRQVDATGLETAAYDIKWDSTAITDQSEFAEGGGYKLDFTADCDRQGGTVEPDQLDPRSSDTDLPNFGAYSYNDCGGTSAKEEIELTVRLGYASPGSPYQWRVGWRYTMGGLIDGEVYFSAEREWPVYAEHDFLEKEQYWYGT